MNTVERYLEKQSQLLNLEFEKIKIIFRDRDVKGGINEKIIEKFVSENYKCNFVSIGVEIFDSNDNSCNEIDICLSNNYQPFSSDFGQPLIAEGVDFVIQVKGTITSQEIGKIQKNSSSVKKLIRKPNIKDKLINVEPGDVEYFINRIPYIVIAFDSQLKLETIAEKFNRIYNGQDFELQPDAIFVVNKGCIINFRKGKGRVWKSDNKKIVGFSAIFSKDHTLLEFLRYIHSFIPRQEKFTHPLHNYFETDIKYKVKGITIND